MNIIPRLSYKRRYQPLVFIQLIDSSFLLRVHVSDTLTELLDKNLCSYSHRLESDITAGLEHDLALQNHKLQKLIGRLTERVRSLECQLQVAQSESRQQTPIPQPSHQPDVATEHLRQLDAAQAEIATLKVCLRAFYFVHTTRGLTAQ